LVFDLIGDPKLEPIVGMLFAMVEENFNRLKKVVEGMSQAELDYKGPNNKYNSTGQLIRHLTYVDLNWTYRIMGDPVPQDLEGKYGPMLDLNNRIPPVSGLSLERLLSDYDEVFRLFTEACLQLTDSQLFHTVEYENGVEATIRWGIWHIADHNRYHQAHIKWFQGESPNY
jgi:uncharacterized damage-inducible protein DinB